MRVHPDEAALDPEHVGGRRGGGHPARHGLDRLHGRPRPGLPGKFQCIADQFSLRCGPPYMTFDKLINICIFRNGDVGCLKLNSSFLLINPPPCIYGLNT